MIDFENEDKTAYIFSSYVWLVVWKKHKRLRPWYTLQVCGGSIITRWVIFAFNRKW